MRRAWLNRAAYAFLIGEANRAFPNETGGVLVGYRAENGDLVINRAIGPGPRAVHSAKRFFPDHEWQCEQLDKLYIKSPQDLMYVGDWHTHPNGVPELSWLDRRTLRGIAMYTEACTLSPIMMIGGGDIQSWNWKIHEYSDDRLFGMLIVTTQLTPKLFDS